MLCVITLPILTVLSKAIEKKYSADKIVQMVKNYSESIPVLEIMLLRPRGIKVSIPDYELITSFEFNANINKYFKNVPVSRKGQIHGIVTEPHGSKWTYYNYTTEFKVKDKVYYWCLITMLDNHQVFKVDQDFTVGANFTVPLLGRSDFFKMLPKKIEMVYDPETHWDRVLESESYYLPHKSHYVDI